MQKRLIATIPCESGELYSLISSQRMKLADCKPQIEIYEHISTVPTLGRAYSVKSYHAALVFCDDMELIRAVDEAYLRTVNSFELSADIQRKDGVFEVLHFTNLQPVEIELGGKWMFDMQEPPERIRHLLEL